MSKSLVTGLAISRKSNFLERQFAADDNISIWDKLCNSFLNYICHNDTLKCAMAE